MKKQKRLSKTKLHWRSIFYHYWQSVRKRLGNYIAIVALFSVATAITYVANPVIYKEIIDVAADPSENIANDLYTLFIYLAIAIIVAHALSRVGNYIAAKTQPVILAGLTNYSLEKINRNSYAYFTNTLTGSIIAKTERFKWAFIKIFSALFFHFSLGLITLIATLSVLWWNSGILAAIFLIWFSIYVLTMYILLHYQIPKNIKRAEAHSKTNGKYTDIISNFFTVKMFGLSADEEKKFTEVVEKERVMLEEDLMQTRFWNNVWLYTNIAVFEIVLMGAAIYLFLKGDISVGTIVITQMYVIVGIARASQLIDSVLSCFTALTDANEIVQIFDRPVEVTDPKKTGKNTLARRGD